MSTVVVVMAARYAKMTLATRRPMPNTYMLALLACPYPDS